MSTTVYEITLTDAATGTWTCGDMTVATGVMLPARGLDGWAIAAALEPHVRALTTPDPADDILLRCMAEHKPIGATQPEMGFVCAFRIIGTEWLTQV